MDVRGPFLLLVAIALGLPLTRVNAREGAAAEYVGGTAEGVEAGGGSIVVTHAQTFVFITRGRHLQIPFSRINLLEYGQKVDRRYLEAVIVSPLFLLSKKRRHFLTIGYEDEGGAQQALVFRIHKNQIRSVLVALEARTGRKVQFQDEDARRAGKG